MKRREWIHIALLVTVAVALYAKTLGNGFVWDDWLVHLDSSFKALKPKNISAFFAGGNPYPLSALFNAINYSIWGINAANPRDIWVVLEGSDQRRRRFQPKDVPSDSTSP